MLANNVILQQSGYPGPVGAVRAGIERFHLTEEVHVLPQAAPVAVTFRTLEAPQLVLAASPNVSRQSIAEESQLGWNTIRVSCKHNDKRSRNRENKIGFIIVLVLLYRRLNLRVLPNRKHQLVFSFRENSPDQLTKYQEQLLRTVLNTACFRYYTSKTEKKRYSRKDQFNLVILKIIAFLSTQFYLRCASRCFVPQNTTWNTLYIADNDANESSARCSSTGSSNSSASEREEEIAEFGESCRLFLQSRDYWRSIHSIREITQANGFPCLCAWSSELEMHTRNELYYEECEEAEDISLKKYCRSRNVT